MAEKWRDIEGFEGLYQISNEGRVYSHIKDIVMKSRKDHHGYLFIGLTKDTKQIHFLISRLVSLAFIKNPLNKLQVNHIDGNKLNNKEDNLEWNTRQENMNHAKVNGLVGGKPVNQIDRDTGKIIQRFDSGTHASIQTNTRSQGISMCCNRNQKTTGGFKWEFSEEGSE